ncbi:MAG: minichromosome maintenance protein MCM [Thermoplasmata archaeon]
MVAARPTLPSPLELSGRWAAVFEEAGLRPAILQIAERYPEERSLSIPFATVEAIDTALADVLLERPETVLAAGSRAMQETLPFPEASAPELRLRVTGLPATAHRPIREIREGDLGRFLAIDGIVRKVSEVRPQIRDAVFQCLSCGVEFHEPQDEGSLVFQPPIECPSAQGGCGKPAGRTRFRLLAERSTFVDAQRIEVQETPESLHRGAHPQGLAVLLLGDLAGHVVPGNRVVANGTLRSYQRIVGTGRGGTVRNATFDLLLLGNSIESKEPMLDEVVLTEEEERQVRQFEGDPTVVDKIVLSLAPTIKDMDQEKEAIALQLFGGVEKRHPDGVRTRGDIHILLIGDPGTAKSQLLRYVAEIALHGIYTSGKGATAAGLTAAAVKDDFAGGRWVLEAGMLVLADGGMAVVDELDKMTPEDRSAMHEALEQQTVSVAKAGITATLNARCAVLAAANPKLGRFRQDTPMAQQLDLPATLLSRFDAIFSILDKPQPERDRKLAAQILKSHHVSDRLGEAGGAAVPPTPFSAAFLKKYVAYARQRVRPVLSPASLKALEDFYVRVRRQGEGPDAPVPITARQLEALIRFSEAAARARLSPEVGVEDAERAIRVVENFLGRVSRDDKGALDIDLVMTGHSHSQRERLEVLLSIMRRLQERPEGAFTLAEVQREAQNEGIDPPRAEALFYVLRNQGELVEIRPDLYQLVRF